MDSDILWVEWVDAVSCAGWTDIEDYQGRNLDLCESVGFLVHEDEQSLTLAAARSAEQVNATIAIPKACVLRTKRMTARE